jgi:hypothetical protein
MLYKHLVLNNQVYKTQESLKLACFNNCTYKRLVELKQDPELGVKCAFI